MQWSTVAWSIRRSLAGLNGFRDSAEVVTKSFSAVFLANSLASNLGSRHLRSK